jgi:hypothetical protein
MRGWIILFAFLTLAFCFPDTLGKDPGSSIGACRMATALFGTLTAVCTVALARRTMHG